MVLIRGLCAVAPRQMARMHMEKNLSLGSGTVIHPSQSLAMIVLTNRLCENGRPKAGCEYERGGKLMSTHPMLIHFSSARYYFLPSLLALLVVLCLMLLLLTKRADTLVA